MPGPIALDPADLETYRSVLAFHEQAQADREQARALLTDADLRRFISLEALYKQQDRLTEKYLLLTGDRVNWETGAILRAPAEYDAPA